MADAADTFKLDLLKAGAPLGRRSFVAGLALVAPWASARATAVDDPHVFLQRRRAHLMHLVATTPDDDDASEFAGMAHEIENEMAVTPIKSERGRRAVLEVVFENLRDNLTVSADEFEVRALKQVLATL